jgi:hypothetical protein
MVFFGLPLTIFLFLPVFPYHSADLLQRLHVNIPQPAVVIGTANKTAEAAPPKRHRRSGTAEAAADAVMTNNKARIVFFISR